MWYGAEPDYRAASSRQEQKAWEPRSPGRRHNWMNNMKAFSKFLCVLSFTTFCVACDSGDGGSGAVQNVLSNPGAEVGDMTGWNFDAGVVHAIDSLVETSGTVLPRTGGFFFDMSAAPSASAEMAQEVNVSGLGGTPFMASGWIQTECINADLTCTSEAITDNDYGELAISFFDNVGALISLTSTGPIGNPVSGTGPDGYKSFLRAGTIPAGAVRAEYKLTGTLVGGRHVNVFFDDLSFEVSANRLQVAIEINPGMSPNGVNPGSTSVIPVAVLGSVDFDATQVDFLTVVFGPGEASSVHDGHVENVNGDAFADMVFQFNVSDTGFACGDTDATLAGETFDAVSFTGTEAVKIAGCE